MRSKFLLTVILFMLIGRQLYAAGTTITSFSPASGPVGTLVTITGTNLTAPTNFTIGGVAPIIVSNTGTTLVALVMRGATTGPIAITTAGGTATSAGNFTITTRPAYNMVQNGNVLAGPTPYYANLGESVAISADGKTAVVGGETTNPQYTFNDVSAAFVFTFAADAWKLQAILTGTGELQNAYGSAGTVAISADGNTVLLGVPFDQASNNGDAYVFTRSGATWIQQGSALYGSGAVGRPFEGSSVALSADGNTAVIGGPQDNSYIGAGWVFTRNAGVWTQQGNKLVGTGYTNAGAGSYEGNSVAISADGNTLIMGAPSDNNYLGASWIFTFSGGTWTQQGNKLLGNDSNISGDYVQQGCSVALSADGSTAMVGGFADNDDVGAAWVYVRSGAKWAQQGSKLLSNSTAAGPDFGSFVALSADGNLALIGAQQDVTNVNGSNSIGSCYEFTRTGTVWTQFGTKLVGIAGGNGTQQQGASAALTPDGITAMAGAPEYLNNAGAAYVFTTTSPSATTLPASAVATTTATINGTVDEQVASGFAGAANYNLLTTTVTMVYGTSPTLATKTTATLTTGASPMTGGAAATTFASALTGLTPGTTYYFMITGVNSFGTANGSILNFTTTAAALLPATITFPAITNQVYGSADVTPGATSTNTVTPITYASSINAVATITQTGTIHIVGVGATQITASQAASTTYTAATPMMQTLTVLPAPLLITPNNQTIAEGSAIPLLTATYTTFVNGDTQASLTTQATITTTATLGSAPGQYPITSTGAVDPNYTITYAAGTLTIGAGAPIATTMQATSITASGATLNGTVNDNGAATTVTIQYSTDPALATAVSTATLTTGASPIAAGTGTVAFTSVLTGLAPATTYYFRISGTNSTATTNGSILSFTTAPPVVITFAPPGYVVYGSTTVPVISSTDPTSPIYYRIGNTAVASVTAANDFLATGVGATYILAYQYAPGTTDIEATAQQNIMVNPAPLTIAAADVTIPWGQPAPAFTATYTGFVNGDTQASLPPGALPVFSTPYSTGSAAGNYNIFSSPNAISNGGNYNITYATSTLTVTPVYPQPIASTDPATAINSTGATINGMADDNGAATTVTLQYTDDDGDGLQDLITATLTTGPGTLPAGSGNTNYAAILTGLQPGTTYYFIITASNPEFSATGNVLTFTTPAVLGQVITFTAPASAVYGSADLTPKGTSSNSNIPITYTSSNTAVATITSGGNIHIVSAGTTTITASQAAGSGFTAATPVSLTFTVNPAPLTVTAGSTTAVYGAGIPPLSVTYNGFVGNDSVDSLTTRATVSTTAIGDSGAGNYPATASGASDHNYTITYVAGNLSITPAALTITANNQSMTTGAAVPALTVSYTGFVNDDGAGNLVTQPTVTTTATSSSVAGTYPITVSGAVDPNYTITYVAGVLTVNGPFVFNPLPAKTYGDADFSPGAMGTNVTYSSGSTSIAIITDGGNIHIVGAGTSVITATSNGVSLQQTLTVSPAALTITAADLARVYNAANPDFTFNYTGFVYSDNAASLTMPPAGTTTATTTSDVGSYPITVSGASDPNYTITYVGGTLTINKAPQTIGFTTIPDQTINGKYDLSPVNASSGLPVSFALTDPTIAMISGSTLTSLQVGTETLTASQAGDDNYLPAANVSQTFNIIDDSGNDIIVNQVVSPNGDGIDDILNIKNIENYPKNKLALVNRDGIMIYQASGYNNTTTAFDGHSNITGALQQQGTLLYILEYWANGQYHRKTGFTVLRY